MIKVTIDTTEYDEGTLEIVSVVHETYTGELARKWLKEHPEVYGDCNNNKSNTVDEASWMTQW